MKRYLDDQGAECLAGRILNAISAGDSVELVIEGADMRFRVGPTWTLNAGINRMSQFLGGWLVQYAPDRLVWVEQHSFSCRFSLIAEEDQGDQPQRLIVEEPTMSERIDGPVYRQILEQIRTDLGLTMRDQFAMSAAACSANNNDDSAQTIAIRAYEIADAMIIERAKGAAL